MPVEEDWVPVLWTECNDVCSAIGLQTYKPFPADSVCIGLFWSVLPLLVLFFPVFSTKHPSNHPSSVGKVGGK